mgnify:CR=1 FL=1
MRSRLRATARCVRGDEALELIAGHVQLLSRRRLRPPLPNEASSLHEPLRLRRRLAVSRVVEVGDALRLVVGYVDRIGREGIKPDL